MWGLDTLALKVPRVRLLKKAIPALHSFGYGKKRLSRSNNNNNDNGGLYSALTKISTTHFTIAVYK